MSLLLKGWPGRITQSGARIGTSPAATAAVQSDGSSDCSGEGGCGKLDSGDDSTNDNNDSDGLADCVDDDCTQDCDGSFLVRLTGGDVDLQRVATRHVEGFPSERQVYSSSIASTATLVATDVVGEVVQLKAKEQPA